MVGGRWDGFAEMVAPGGRTTLGSDLGGPDDEPVPLASLKQRLDSLLDVIELDSEELRWLVEVAGPQALVRMGERP